MKPVRYSLVLLLVTCLCGFVEPTLKVGKDFSDQQIKKVERQVLHKYGTKVEVKVVSRNSRNEITNLECIRYDKSGQPGATCASDNFGLLIVTKDGCRIADVGHENSFSLN